MVVNSDAHTVGNLMDEKTAAIVARGAGLTEEEILKALNDTPYEMIKHLIK